MAATSFDETQLVAALRRGEDRAYEQVVRDNGGRLLQVARRFVGEDEAQDALQEGLVSAFRSIDRFDGRSKFSTWLHRIVVNASLMRLRKRGRGREESLDDLLPTFLDDGHFAELGPSFPEDPERLAQRAEVRRLVRSSIDELPDNYRVVVLLRDIEGFDGKETAEALAISPGAVKVRLHRARQALRTILARRLREVDAPSPGATSAGETLGDDGSSKGRGA
ncbi:MAG: sigma-70 family RNA polymerase sigma factor [Acidobacteriota bacterium]